jgi:hypothetical protein
MGTEVAVGLQTYAKPRRWPRYKLDIPVRVIATKEGKVKLVQGRGNELNEGGLTVFAGIELSLGEEIAVEYTPAYSGSPIRARAIVRDRKGYKYGAELLVETDSDLQNAERIRAILQSYGVPIF